MSAGDYADNAGRSHSLKQIPSTAMSPGVYQHSPSAHDQSYGMGLSDTAVIPADQPVAAAHA
ncbi:MAG: hypothetical protein ACK5YO_38565, partial [Planctomyces sp.]